MAEPENSRKAAKPRGRPFVKGQSGNPGGRPKMAACLREQAQGDAPEAYAQIVRIMRESEKGSEVLSAAARVLQIAGVPMNAAAPAQEPEASPPSVPDAELDQALGELN